MKNVFAQLTLSSLVFTAWLVIVQHGFAFIHDVPPDVLKVQPTGYAYADYPGIFDDIDEGITIEAWVYLNEIPKDRKNSIDRNGNWLIFGKDGSYSATISGRNLRQRQDRDSPEGLAWFDYRLEYDGAGVKGGGRSIYPDTYLRKWVHIALQIATVEDGVNFMSFYDQEWPINPSNAPYMGRINSPLTIGGPTFMYGRQKHIESMKGYIDEVRVSKGMRYNKGGKIRAERPLQADVQTIALWRFEEGAGAHSYRDSSGNGYTLLLGGSLAVHPLSKLATTWGSLKRRN